MLPSRRRTLRISFGLLAALMLCAACATDVAPQPDATGTDVEKEVEHPTTTQQTVEPAPVAMPPAEPPTPTEARELVRRAVAALAEGVAVRLDKDRYLGAVFDLDGNGRLEIGLLVLGAEFAELADFAVLSDATRLYVPDARTPDLFLAVLNRDGDQFSERHRFAIGKRRVVSDVSVHPLRLDHGTPAAFVVTVVTRDGSEQYWCAFNADGGPTSLLADNTGTTRTIIADIDNTQRLDFVRYQPVFEKGRGYDTLISRTRWTAAGFEPAETTNVVRNLTRFLERAARNLELAAWGQFIDRVVLPAAADGLRQQGFEDTAIIDVLFLPENGISLTAVARQHGIAEVVFPDIVRNPFRDIGVETSFRTLLRVVTPETESYFYEARIGMQQNPFQPQQFFFAPIAFQGE